jgi:putative transposon-encoded protein
MYKQIVTPKDTKLMLQIPKEFVGQKIEVIAFPVEEEKPWKRRRK